MIKIGAPQFGNRTTQICNTCLLRAILEWELCLVTQQCQLEAWFQDFEADQESYSYQYWTRVLMFRFLMAALARRCPRGRDHPAGAAVPFWERSCHHLLYSLRYKHVTAAGTGRVWADFHGSWWALLSVALVLKKATKSQSIHRTRSAAIVQLGSREMALRSVTTMSDVRKSETHETHSNGWTSRAIMKHSENLWNNMIIYDNMIKKNPHVWCLVRLVGYRAVLECKSKKNSMSGDPSHGSIGSVGPIGAIMGHPQRQRPGPSKWPWRPRRSRSRWARQVLGPVWSSHPFCTSLPGRWRKLQRKAGEVDLEPFLGTKIGAPWLHSSILWRHLDLRMIIKL